MPRLLDDLTLARGDGQLARKLKALARVDLLILDDWGLSTMTSMQGRDILEIVDDRHGRRSTIVTSQLPVEKWHDDDIPDPTVARQRRARPPDAHRPPPRAPRRDAARSKNVQNTGMIGRA